MASAKVQFRPGPLTERLTERSDNDGDAAISEIAARDLDRYYDLLLIALARIDLTEAEAGFLVDIMNGTIFEPFVTAGQAFVYEIEDAEPEYDGKWSIDRAALITKIRGYSLLERAAICDAIERFWGDAYHIDNTRARLVRVGLVRS